MSEERRKVCGTLGSVLLAPTCVGFGMGMIGTTVLGFVVAALLLAVILTLFVAAGASL